MLHVDQAGRRHTLARLPTGIFYAPGSEPRLAKAKPSSSTANPPRKAVECEPHLHMKLWSYDLRTNLHFTLKENTPKRSDLDDLESPARLRLRYGSPA